MLLRDGKGRGHEAGVNSDNQLLAYATVLDAIDAAAVKGESYNVTTDVLTLTGTAESAVLYVANSNPRQHMNLLRLAWSFGKSNAPGDVIVRGYTNPTGGTLLTAGTPISFLQRNLGSRFVAQGTATKMSAVGQTITGATIASVRVFQDGSQHELVSGFLVPAGSSFALTVAPPAGNTSMRCALTASIFYVDKE